MIMNGLVLGGAIMAIAIATAFVVGQRYLGKHRGVSREKFVRTFANVGIPTEIPAAVYDFYKSRVIPRNFSIAPDDKYSALLEGDDEIDDDAESLMKKLDLRPPSEEVQVQWIQRVLASRRKSLGAPGLTVDAAPIQTLRDMVFWLDWVRQHQETTSSK